MRRAIPEKASMDFEKGLDLIFPDAEPKVISTENMKKISVCEPLIGDIEREYVKNVMDSGWVSSLGPEVKKFEKEFASKIGVDYAISCTSGTAALHLALVALGIGPGDEVIVPAFTMIATVSAVLYCGATPILVDADENMNIDVDQIESKINPNTKCILPVHIYGYPCNMGKIMKLANKYNLWVVEDVAESHGASYDGKMTGAIGDIGIYSSYANKIITTGEGGILTTNEPELAERVRTLMNHAFSPERHFCHRLEGFNYRLTALQAALGRAQLTQWDELIDVRRRLRNRYIRNLSKCTLIDIPNIENGEGIAQVCWMFGVTVDRAKKNIIRKLLADKGIETRNFFVPMHLQPVHYKRFEGQRYPEAEKFMEIGFYLPSSAVITDDEIDYICRQFIDIVKSL